MLVLLPRAVSSMFLNDTKFASDGIATLYNLLTHLNPPSSENLLLSISDITCLEMGLGDSSINYISCVRSISQWIQGVTMGKIIPLFDIARLDHYRYPGVKIRHLVGNLSMVNCNVLDLSGLLSREDNRQQALILPSSTPPDMVNRVSDTQAQPPPTGRPQPPPNQPPTASDTD